MSSSSVSPPSGCGRSAIADSRLAGREKPLPSRNPHGTRNQAQSKPLSVERPRAGRLPAAPRPPAKPRRPPGSLRSVPSVELDGSLPDCGTGNAGRAVREESGRRPSRVFAPQRKEGGSMHESVLAFAMVQTLISLAATVLVVLFIVKARRACRPAKARGVPQGARGRRLRQEAPEERRRAATPRSDGASCSWRSARDS